MQKPWGHVHGQLSAMLGGKAWWQGCSAQDILQHHKDPSHTGAKTPKVRAQMRGQHCIYPSRTQLCRAGNPAFESPKAEPHTTGTHQSITFGQAVMSRRLPCCCKQGWCSAAAGTLPPACSTEPAGSLPDEVRLFYALSL